MNKNLQIILGIGGVVLVLGFLARRQVAIGVEAIDTINEGTPFEGAGIIGTAGNIANRASGGILADAGSAIGLFFSNIFDRRTLEDFDTSLTGGRGTRLEFVGPPSAEFIGG